MEYLVPKTDRIYDMLSMLCGEELEVSDTTEPGQPNDFVGIYIDDTGIPKAACTCDFSFAAYTSAAFTMMPPATAHQTVETKEVTPMLMDTLNEVANILTRVLIDNDTAHLKLKGVKSAAEAKGELTVIQMSSKEYDFVVDIPRYGTGRIRFLVKD